MFRLKDLLKHESITIQCHNYPDADTLASAFAIYTYLQNHGKTAKIIYGGEGRITKPNLTKMVSLLNIPVTHETPGRVKVLCLVDCQYGGDNVEYVSADVVYTFDHHEELDKGHTGIIHSNIGSTSTILWGLLKAENFDFIKHQDVATALYYGLFMDTNSLEEIAHPMDRDMRDKIFYNKDTIKILRFNNLSVEELEIAGTALTRYKMDKDLRYAMVRADACDQNILGFIADLALQVDGVCLCLVYNTLPTGYKISVRSCTREVMANEFMRYIGEGGGHRNKAGGYIPKNKANEDEIDSYIEKRIIAYFNSYDVIDADNHNIDVSSMPTFEKLKVPQGVASSTSIFPAGTPLLIRTMDGDSDMRAADDLMLMIGPEGEVYPISLAKFKKGYVFSGDGFDNDFAYIPTIKNKTTEEMAELTTFARSCLPVGKVHIHAKKLTRFTKVFRDWNPDGYMLGNPGDYLAVRSDDLSDIYIIKEGVFAKTYRAYGLHSFGTPHG